METVLMQSPESISRCNASIDFDWTCLIKCCRVWRTPSPYFVLYQRYSRIKSPRGLDTPWNWRKNFFIFWVFKLKSSAPSCLSPLLLQTGTASCIIWLLLLGSKDERDSRVEFVYALKSQQSIVIVQWVINSINFKFLALNYHGELQYFLFCVSIKRKQCRARP